MPAGPSPQSQDLLQAALKLHTEGKINAAIEAAQAAVTRDPENVEALQYLGSTYVARKKEFARGLEYLEQALELAPDDPIVLYTLGWCYEFAAHELSRRRGRWGEGSPPPIDQLYEQAIWALRRAVALQTDPGLQDDAVKLLESILGEDVDVAAIVARGG